MATSTPLKMQTPYPPLIYGIPMVMAPFFSVWLHRQPSLSAGWCTLLVGLFGAAIMLAAWGIVRLVRGNRPPLQVSWRSFVLQLVGVGLLAPLGNFAAHALFPR